MSTPAESLPPASCPHFWNHQLDALIERYGREPDDRKAKILLDDIFRRFGVEAIRRSVERAVGRTRAGIDDAEDLIGEVAYSLIARLRRWRSNHCAKVECFGSYAESVTRNAVHSRTQREQPLRTKLIANLRYAVSSSPHLRFFKSESGITLIGLVDSASDRPDAVLLAKMLEEPRNLALVLRLNEPVASLTHRDVVTRLIRAIGGPVPFYSVVNILAGARELADGRAVPESQFDSGPFHDRIVDDAPDAQHTAILKQEIAALWQAIQQLPVLQRAALLLNLRDPLGRGVIALLLETRIANEHQIACAVGMTAEELESRWDALPMDDRSIAARYGITAVQVVSLRRNARTRLRRGPAPVQTIVFKPSRSRATA